MYYIAIWIMIFVIKQYYNLKLFQGTNLSPTVSNMSDETGVIFMAILFLSFIITALLLYFTSQLPAAGNCCLPQQDDLTGPKCNSVNR